MGGVHPLQKVLAIEWLGRAGVFAGNQGIVQRSNLSFMGLKQAQPGPDDLARRPVASSLDLRVDELREVFP
jgi:hypothetical protein